MLDIKEEIHEFFNNYNSSIIQKFEKQNKGFKLIDTGDSFYVDIDFNKVKGFEKLSDRAKKVFKEIYKIHNGCAGLDYKIRWIPKSVKEHKTHLEVHFSGKVWQHWLPNGVWY